MERDAEANPGNNAPRGRRAALIWRAATAGATLALIGLFAWMIFGGDESVDSTPAVAQLSEFGLPALEIPRDELRTAWQPMETRAEETSLSEADERLLAHWRRANAYAFEDRETDGSGAQAMNPAHALGLELQHWLRTQGPDAYRVLSWKTWDLFFVSLSSAAEAARAAELPLATWAQAAESDLADSYREHCGNFHEYGVQLGLVDRYGEPRVDPMLLLIVYRYRWFSAANEFRPIDFWLDDTELATFYRWRVQAADGIEIPRKLRYLQEYVDRFGDYAGMTLHEARAAIWWDAGVPEQALEELRAYRRRTGREDRDGLIRALERALATTAD